MRATTSHEAKISGRVGAHTATPHIRKVVRAAQATHRLQEHVAAHVEVELTPSAAQPAFRNERAARRSFGAVLASLVCHELDDELFDRLIARHPRCERALDNLLSDLMLDAPAVQLADLRDAHREQAEFDAMVDSDCDGLG